MQARVAAIRKTMTVPRVRVVPANDDVRRVLRHPRGMRFRSTGSVEWPLDSFTQRRINEGAITIERPAAAASTAPSHDQRH